jgi:transcriptional regulator with XRE-family HTH domain
MLRGDRLRALRERKGFTHSELAEQLNLGVRQIARYESEETDPSGEIVGRIAQVFNVSSDYLLGLTDDPSPHFRVDNLTDQERRILTALRRGETVEAMRALVNG